jgi:hypothetical protein
MSLTLRATRAAVQCIVLALCLQIAASAQSGRCSMKGFVIGDGDIHTIAGATVELAGDPADGRVGKTKLTATTNEQGEYLIEDIPHGPYVLTVSAPGRTTYRIPIYMLSDVDTQLHVRLEKAGT